MHPKATKDEALLPRNRPHTRPHRTLPLWPQCPQTPETLGVWLPFLNRELPGLSHGQFQLNNKYPHPQSDRQIKISVSRLDPVSCLSSSPGCPLPPSPRPSPQRCLPVNRAPSPAPERCQGLAGGATGVPPGKVWGGEVTLG